MLDERTDDNFKRELHSKTRAVAIIEDVAKTGLAVYFTELKHQRQFVLGLLTKMYALQFLRVVIDDLMPYLQNYLISGLLKAC